MAGTPGSYPICYLIPTKKQKGVYYKYPGEQEQFIPNGAFWTCPKNSGDIFTAQFNLQITCQEYPFDPYPTIKPRTVNRSMLPVYGVGNDYPFHFRGEPQGIVPRYPQGLEVTRSTALYAGFKVYGFYVFTSEGIYATDPYESNGFFTANSGSCNPPGQNAGPVVSDSEPPFTFATPQSFTMSGVRRLSSFEGAPPTTYVFTVYDSMGNSLFTRTDTTCPSAHIQKDNCSFEGVWKNTSVSGGYLALVYKEVSTDKNGRACVAIKARHPSFSFENPLTGSHSNSLPYHDEVQLYVCSPVGCPPPKVYNELYIPKFNKDCPPGSCKVDCGDFTCCYDPKTGEPTRGFRNVQADPKRLSYNPDVSNDTALNNTSNYVNNNYDSPNIGSDQHTTNNYALTS